MAGGVTETVNLQLSFVDDASRDIARVIQQMGRFNQQQRQSAGFLAIGSRGALTFASAINNVGAVAAVAATAIGRSVSAVARWVDSTRPGVTAASDLAERLGTSTEFITAFGFAAENTGATTADVSVALTALGRRVSAMPESFRRWGIETRNANGELKDTETVAGLVADRVARARTQSERLAIAQDTMSESGRKLVTVLAGGAEGLREWRMQAEEANALVSGEMAAQIGALDTSFVNLNTAIQSISREILAGLSPGLRFVTAQMTIVARETSKWIREMDIPQAFVDVVRWLGTVGLPAMIETIGDLRVAFNVLAVPVEIVLGAIGRLFEGATRGFAELFGLAARAAAAVGRGGLAQSFINAGDAAMTAADFFREFADSNIDSVNTIDERIARIRDTARESAEAVALIGAEVANAAQTVSDTSLSAPEARAGGAGGPRAPDAGAQAEFRRRQQARIKAVFDANRRILDFELQTIEARDKAWAESNERQNRLLMEQAQLLQGIFGSVGSTLGAIATGAQDSEEAIRRLGITVVQQALEFIAAKAAEAAAAAFVSQASIPIIGPILGAAAAASALAFVSAFAGEFHEGGIVTRNGRVPLPRELTRAPSQGEMFARVREGEIILPQERISSGGPPAGGLQGPVIQVQARIESYADVGRASFQRTTENVFVPALRMAAERGVTEEPLRIRGRVRR